jgi:hypothetical protein
MTAQAARSGPQQGMNDKRDADGVRMLREDEVRVARPPLWLLLAEGRVGAEFVAYLLSQPWLRRLPRGDGQPVLAAISACARR